MRCPACGIECRVQATDVTLRFFCRNKKCPRYSQKNEVGHEVAEKKVKKPE